MLEIKTKSGEATAQPLERVSIRSSRKGLLAVRDGAGREYVRRRATKSARVQVGGALGTHVVHLLDDEGRMLETATCRVDCRTGIEDSGGRFAKLHDMAYWTMSRWGKGTRSLWWRGKFYHFFVRWLRDHVHAMKGMKYYWPELKTGIELYRDSQREDGMIWDNVMPRTREYNTWQWRFEYGDFIRLINDPIWELKRIPVENDVEYLYLEGIYWTWKATGDDAWMASCLDSALRAVHYSTHDPYRWSAKYKLLKRGFTVDTWDFQAAPDAAISGDPMCIRLDDGRFGVMHGDNTGFAAACRYLAEMLEHVRRRAEAARIRTLGRQIKRRLDKLAWNGRFYTHHVPEDRRVRRDLGVDLDQQVSVSNAYALGRGLPHEQCAAILRTYQRIREQMPASSPGEFYQIYPPFERGFGPHNARWEYMNGGVSTIVAGELARVRVPL
ncbi:MAG: hypothetical protein ACLF0G_18190 [Candidatus Brocadiia bacterium]